MNKQHPFFRHPVLTNMRTERRVRTWRSQPMFLPADLAYHVMAPSLLPAGHTSPSHRGHCGGFTTCYLSTVYCSAQVINILDFSFRDCGLKQKAGLYYGQMARQELNCTRLLMNSVSNAYYYIVVLITITSPYLYTWCAVSRVTCSRAELRIPTERGAGGDWAGTLEGRHGECGPCAAHCMQSHTSIISIFTLNFKMLHIFRLTILFKLLHTTH